MRYCRPIFLLVALVFVGCGQRKAGEIPETPKRMFPDFKAVASDSEKYSEKDFAKGPAIASFLVSWCLTCGYELVALEEIREEFDAEKLPIIIFTY